MINPYTEGEAEWAWRQDGHHLYGDDIAPPKPRPILHPAPRDPEYDGPEDGDRLNDDAEEDGE